MWIDEVVFYGMVVLFDPSSVTDLWSFERNVKLNFLLGLRFDKSKMKAKAPNPSRTFVDIRPIINKKIEDISNNGGGDTL